MSTDAPDPARRAPDLGAFARAVRFRDRAVAAAVAHHEWVSLTPSSHYARATFDAIADLIREDERDRLAAAGRLAGHTPDPPSQGEAGSGTKRLPAVSTDPAYIPDPADPVWCSAVNAAASVVYGEGMGGGDILAEALTAAIDRLGARLLPADVETRTEWGVLWDSPGGQRSRQSVYDEDEARAAVAAAEPGWTPYLVSRMSWVGPWLPAPTTEES